MIQNFNEQFTWGNIHKQRRSKGGGWKEVQKVMWGNGGEGPILIRGVVVFQTLKTSLFLRIVQYSDKSLHAAV